MLYVAPETVHTEPAPAENVTAFPLPPPVAATVNVSPLAEAAGGGTVNVMVWLAGTAFTFSVSVAAE
jgi:hypothetical protein